MKNLRNQCARALIASLVLALVGGVASAMTVQPVVVDLKPVGHDMSATVSVQNSGAQAMPVELTAQSLEFTEDGAKATGKDSGELLMFPPQALIPAGQTQVFRIQWVGDPELAASKHYYVTVAQLPVKLPEGTSAIQILYDFRVLVNVAASHGKAILSIDKADMASVAPPKPVPGQSAAAGTTKYEPEIWVKNAGPNYGYLSHATLRISENDTSGKEIFNKKLDPQDIQQTVGFGVIGPNTIRKVVLPVELPSAQGSVKVEMVDAGEQ